MEGRKTTNHYHHSQYTLIKAIVRVFRGLKDDKSCTYHYQLSSYSIHHAYKSRNRVYKGFEDDKTCAYHYYHNQYIALIKIVISVYRELEDDKLYTLEIRNIGQVTSSIKKITIIAN